MNVVVSFYSIPFNLSVLMHQARHSLPHAHLDMHLPSVLLKNPGIEEHNADHGDQKPPSTKTEPKSQQTRHPDEPPATRRPLLRRHAAQPSGTQGELHVPAVPLGFLLRPPSPDSKLIGPSPTCADQTALSTTTTTTTTPPSPFRPRVFCPSVSTGNRCGGQSGGVSDQRHSR